MNLTLLILFKTSCQGISKVSMCLYFVLPTEDSFMNWFVKRIDTYGTFGKKMEEQRTEFINPLSFDLFFPFVFHFGSRFFSFPLGIYQIPMCPCILGLFPVGVPPLSCLGGHREWEQLNVEKARVGNVTVAHVCVFLLLVATDTRILQ